MAVPIRPDDDPGRASSPWPDEALIVRTRFLPPRLRPSLLERPRVHALLARLHEQPLLLLRAEAGYGKTTAVASYLVRSELPFFWYGLSSSDADPMVFLLHLVHLFRGLDAGIGEHALRLLAHESGALRLWAPAVDALANDLLDAVPRDEKTVLVLDDYCMVNRPEINLIVERFIEQAPPQLHIVVTARSMPSWPSRARWRASGELREIGRADLAFTAEEVAALFAHHASITLPAAVAQALAAETEGWPIAIQMLPELAAAQRGTGALDDLLRRIPGPSDLLFDYLASEVFLRQPPDVQAFLTESAVLHRLDPVVCDALLERNDSAAVLRYLEEHSLFLTYEGAYRYHHLFRDFLLRRGGLSAERRRFLERKAAALYQAQGQIEEAIRHWLAAEDYEAAVALLDTVARELVYSGRHLTLASWLERLPADLLDAHPELLLARGHAARFASRYEEALTWYEQARERFAARNDATGEVRALRGQAQVYLDTVQPRLAEPLLRRALRRTDRRATAERIGLLILLAENRINAGRLREAERLHRRVHRVACRDDIPPMDPRLYVRDGRFGLARRLVEEGLRRDPWGMGQWRAPRSHREAAVLLAWIEAMTGQAEAARRYAEQSLELGRTLGSPIVECVALARLGHGWLTGPDFDPKQARRYYDDSRLLAERIGVPRFQVEALLGLTLIAGLEGRRSEARGYAEEALDDLRRSGDRYMEAMLELALGIALWPGAAEEARTRWQHARELAVRCGDRFLPCLADLWSALAYHHEGRLAAAQEAWERCWQAVQEHDYGFLFTHFPLLGPKGAAPRAHMDALRQGSRRPLSAAPPVYAALPSSPVGEPTPTAVLPTGLRDQRGLYIQTLGPFRVWRHGYEIPSTAWGREKALHLLQVLVCHRGHPLHREQVMEALWPESPSAHAATGLRVALSALRKALAVKPTDADDFIRREGEMIQLDMTRGVRVDADEFLRLLQEARRLETIDPSRAVTLYESGLALYRGDFLEENPYAEWAIEERERLQMEYLMAAERLARLLLGRDDCEGAMRWANAILAKDPLWEEAYAVLMESQWRQGHRGLAVRTFERCRKRLREALAVEPSPQLLELYQRIVRG